MLHMVHRFSKQLKKNRNYPLIKQGRVIPVIYKSHYIGRYLPFRILFNRSKIPFASMVRGKPAQGRRIQRLAGRLKAGGYAALNILNIL